MLIDKAKTYKRAVARRYLPVSSEEIVSKVREADKYYLSTKFDGLYVITPKVFHDERGYFFESYNKRLLDQNLHSLLTIPFFLFVMTAIASILTLNTLKRSDNFKFIIIGLVVSVIVFYFKDFSLALGQTDRIPLIVSVWVPVIVLSLFAFIGIIQINEK